MNAALKPQSPLRLEAPDTRWQQHAACSSEDPELFFPLNTHSPLGAAQADEAKAVCAACPSRGACLDWAIKTRQAYGVWGGLTADERRRLLRRSQNPAAAGRVKNRPQLEKALNESELILTMLDGGSTIGQIARTIGVGWQTTADAVHILRQTDVEVAA